MLTDSSLCEAPFDSWKNIPVPSTSPGHATTKYGDCKKNTVTWSDRQKGDVGACRGRTCRSHQEPLEEHDRRWQTLVIARVASEGREEENEDEIDQLVRILRTSMHGWLERSEAASSTQRNQVSGAHRAAHHCPRPCMQRCLRQRVRWSGTYSRTRKFSTEIVMLRALKPPKIGQQGGSEGWNVRRERKTDTKHNDVTEKA